MSVPLLILHVIIIIFMLLLLLFNTGIALVAISDSPMIIGKPGCETQCGNVSIPYPFGIGAGCYFDVWYEINCITLEGNTKTPFLNKTYLEVLEISIVQGTLKLKYPVRFTNAPEHESLQGHSTGENLTGSPFVFSQKRNRFTAVNCGMLVYLKSVDEFGNTTIVAACMSICESTKDSSCDGMNCCQTSIPSNLVRFLTEFRSDYYRENAVKYAFLVDQEWFELRSKRYADIAEMEAVPVVMEWNLFYDNLGLKEFGKFPERVDSTSYCKRDSTNSSIFNYQTRVQCFCDKGFEGNPYLLRGCQDINECEDGLSFCGSHTSCVNTIGSYDCREHKHKDNMIIIIIGLASCLGALFLLVGSHFLFKNIKKRKGIKQKENFFKRLLQEKKFLGEVNIDQKTRLFKEKELDKATNQFNVNRILGQGGQGTVFKGMLEDGNIVAVKKSKIVDERNFTEFINEVVILSQLNHRNVVKLLGCCLETEFPLLVYEFIPNGTLSSYIHHHERNDEFPFTWEMRLRIATEIAAALSYLHYAASFPIYHRDIKSTNILLDEKYRAKVADFGTSRSVSIDQTHLTTLVHGTFGYLDPEYLQSSQFTEKSDVYSFGVVLVELLTGQKAISIARSEEGRNLATYFMLSMQENVLFDIVDAQVLVGRKEEIMVVADLARRCLNLNGKQRPNMKQVLMELEGIHMLEKAACTNDVPKHFDQEVQDFINGLETDEVFDAISLSESTLDAGSASLSHELPLLTSKLSKCFS